MQTISEKLNIKTELDLYTLLKNFQEEHHSFLTPSGHWSQVRLVDEEKGLKNYNICCIYLGDIFTSLSYLLYQLTYLPYRERLLTLDEVYNVCEILLKFKEESYMSIAMKNINAIYGFVYAVVNGADLDKELKCCDYYVRDGKLISCFIDNTNEILTLPDTVTEIESYTFVDCGKVLHVIIPESVKKIHEDAFYFSQSFLEVRSSSLYLLEIKGKDTQLCGSPCKGLRGYDLLQDYSFVAIVAPNDSLAEQVALEHNFIYSSTVENAIEQFLSIEEEFEDARDEVRTCYDTQAYFEKAEQLARYGIKRGKKIEKIISYFCTIAFAITEEIRYGYFSQEEAIRYLFDYHLEEEYLQNTRFDSSLVRVMLSLKTEAKDEVERLRVREAFMSLSPKRVYYYIKSLKNETNYNIGYANMFFSGYDDEYEMEEFYQLGQELADLFIRNRLNGWEDILEMCEALNAQLTDERRYGYFSNEMIEQWKK